MDNFISANYPAITCAFCGYCYIMGFKKESQSKKGNNPLEYIRDISNQKSWTSLASEIYRISGESISDDTLRRAAKKGREGFKSLKLTLGQFKALSQIAGFDNLEELLALVEDKKTRSQENKSN
ncbi:MAG: hypothetical protein VKK42_19915 [Lyngbya sp.]|nr:hypothetical protein [Lyngbya sp.]